MVFSLEISTAGINSLFFFSKTTNLSAFWSFIFLLGIRFFSAKFVVKCIFEIQSTIEGGIKILDFTTEIDVC